MSVETKTNLSEDVPEVYIIVEGGVVTAVHSTHDMNMDVIVIYKDKEGCDSEMLEHAESLFRAVSL